MVNSDEFSNRLKEIFTYYELSASSFADKIDVGRASISHILSGRNKPSLDFVMKVVSTFKEVELYWLLNGKGNFPASAKEKEIQQDKPLETDSPKVEADSFQLEASTSLENDHSIENPSTKSIERVIVFYTDGSFKSYENYPKS